MLLLGLTGVGEQHQRDGGDGGNRDYDQKNSGNDVHEPSVGMVAHDASIGGDTQDRIVGQWHLLQRRTRSPW